MKRSVLKKLVLVLIVAVLITSALAFGCSSPSATAPGSTQAGKTVNLFFGSTASSSGFYVWSVAVARVVNKYAPGVNITVVESGATYDNMRKIKEGTFDGGLGEGWNGGYELYRGVETFDKAPWDQIRFFFMRDVSSNRTYVRANSGIKTWADLKGKKINPGIPGSAAVVRVQRANELLSTGANIVPGNMDEGLKDLQTGKIDALYKSGPVNDFDPAMVAAHMTTPLTVIGFSDSEAEKLIAKYPQFMVTKTAPGTIKSQPGHGPLWEIYAVGGAHTSARLSEDISYKIVKALYEHWNEVKQAYPATDNTISDYVKLVPPGLEVPLSAGTVRYAKEAGINIPAHLIPPEYKAK
ncbi:MAG: TAXI family TRAP transporter solute-binding subunit [Dehalococcoidales bacterium]|nr:TAXI family TRAP transporter solute-binding subunit [Dehalococcoidales bacterium]